MEIALLILRIVIVLGAIFIGARYGSIAIGMAGGLGVLLLGASGMAVSEKAIPFDVIAIITAVIAAIAAVQVAGGLDYIVYLTDRFLRKRPKQLIILAPLVTYFMTLLAGTGHTAFAALPVITEVAKENNIRPSRPLSIAVVSSQMAIVASPISAAVVFMASIMEPKGVSYLTLLAVLVPSTLIAVIISAFIMQFTDRTPLAEDKTFQERKAAGLVELKGAIEYTEKRGAKASLVIFLTSLLVVMVYASITSKSINLIANPTIPRNEAIITIMLSAATLIVIWAKIKPGEVLNMPTFKSGMSACVCILGVAWLGTTFVNGYLEQIKSLAGSTMQNMPWMLAIVLFFAAALLYSQASTTKALMPTALALGLSPISAVAAFPAVSALFILPTYPTLIAAVEMDDTGSTRIGKAVFNHPFMMPGIANITLAVLLGYAFGAVLI